MARSKSKQRARMGALERVVGAFKAFRPAAQVLTVVRAVPTRFCQVDHALRVGGWPVERFTLVHGPSNHGKTALAVGLMDSFIAADGLAHYVDAERTTPITWCRTLMGAHADNPLFTADRPETYEATIASVRNYLNTIIRLKGAGDLSADTPALIVVDSLRKLVPKDLMREILQAEKDATAGDVKGGRDRSGQLKAKMNAAWLDELVPMLEKAGAGFVAIGREMQDPDADDWARKFGTDYKVGGGSNIMFDSSVVARVERASWVTNGAREKKELLVYGERHRVTVRKTKLAAKDDKVAVGYFHSSNGTLVPEGFDRARDVLELGVRLGVVEQRGSIYVFEGQRIAAGVNAAVVALSGDLDRLREVELAVRERCRTSAPQEYDPETGEVA
jgi:RecA/RadA recombinase